jgi:alkylation response protein AidB-like acyl-CoA dehydrogenase
MDALPLLLSEVQRFLRTVDAGDIDRARRIPPRVLERAAELGLFGLTIPLAHGGAGAGLGTTCRVIDTVATVDRSLAITLGLHAGLGTRALTAFGSRSLRQAWLPRMAQGTCIGAFAATESGAGSDLTAMRTVARSVQGGARIDGEKSFVTNGGVAGAFTVLVSSPSMGGARGHSLFFVPADSPGVTIGAEEDKLGIRGSSTVTVRFDDVFVGADQLLGEPGRGLEHAHDVLAWGRTIMAAGCVGTARAAVDASLTHVTSRRQFGRDIGAFGAVRQQVVSMSARLMAMDALVQGVGDRELAGEPIATAATIAKVFCSEGAFAICDQAVQLHGALGFLEPTGIARLLRDCRVTRIFEGANDVLLVRLGVARLASRERVTHPASHDLRDAAACAPLSACRALAARLASAIDFVRAKNGVGAVNRQTLLQRIARAHVALEAAVATLPRIAGEDAALAAYAVDEIVAEGERHLDALPSEDAREAQTESLSERLYARVSGAPARGVYGVAS